ncbi:MAG: hypothetical protein D6732_28890 [Methanobacteriota archaeon]|nr:MAG: hypothetical protein D6732_28890 [Euryarchaeota archaeon]
MNPQGNGIVLFHAGRSEFSMLSRQTFNLISGSCVMVTSLTTSICRFSETGKKFLLKVQLKHFSGSHGRPID